MKDLFDPISRDERQQQCVSKWIKNGGKATIEACTGFGKTRVATNIIGKLLEKRPDLGIFIVVPTTTLKEQWEEILKSLGYIQNCRVQVINTAITQDDITDLLIIDEIHRVVADTFKQVFERIKYKLILGLTATIERLDGKHSLLNQYCPVVDTVSLLEATANGWVAPFKEYKVIVDTNDLMTYLNLDKEFNTHFEFFNYDFGLIMSLLGPKGFINKTHYRDKICASNDREVRANVLKLINIHANGFMKALQGRKNYINNHPKKLEIARKIINARSDKKIITFSNNIKMAESIGIGCSYSGRDTKKKGRATLEQIRNGDINVLNTVAKCNEGLDVKGLSVAIILGLDSAKNKAIQRVGRVCRFEPGKQAEIFNIVLDNTVENTWFENSHKGSDYITIDEEGLDAVLRGEDPKPYKKKLKEFMFRF